MANAKKTAPLSNDDVEVLDEPKLSFEDEMLAELGIELEPKRKYMFELAQENPIREMPIVDMREKRNLAHKKFKPYNNIIFTSQIVYNKQRVTIRYYDGCDTLLVSKQPKEKEVVDQLINQTRAKNYHFRNGGFGAYGDEKMLVLYMFIASWNGGSSYKTRTSETIWFSKDETKAASSISKRIDEQEKALKYAKEAATKKMLIHANYLQIATTDWDSGNELTEEAIRAEYRKFALERPSEFIESFNDSSLELRYFIDEALRNRTIVYKEHQAMWKTGTPICAIDGLQTEEGVSAYLMKFAEKKEGEEFVIQLKALSE